MFNSSLFRDMERLFEEQRKLFKTVFDHWDQPFLSLEDKNEEKHEVKEEKYCCEKPKHRDNFLNKKEKKRIHEKLAEATTHNTKNVIEPFHQTISKLEQEEKQQKCTIENMDKYAAHIFSLINRDKEWDDDMKAIANVGIKIYFFAKLFFGGPKALDFYKYVLSIDPNFKKLIQTNNDEKLGKYRAEALAQLVKKDQDEEMYTCIMEPIFKSSVCSTTGCNRESSNGNYKSRVDLSGDNFVLRVISVKNGGPRDGWFVELRKGDGEFAEVYNVTPYTKLADMVDFVQSDHTECLDEEVDDL